MKVLKNYLVKNLPQNVLNDALRYVSNCSVALVGLSLNNKMVSNALASGTLISIGEKYGVLTAKHVWDMFDSRCDIHKIHFSILGYRHLIVESKEYLNPIFLNPEIDICFIEIPKKLVSTIKTYRMFYPLHFNNLRSIDKIKDNLWLTIGFPEKMKSDEKKIINPLRYFTSLAEYHDFKNGYDEIDLIVSYEPVNKDKIPVKLGGMSGGGIWNFQIFFNDDDELKCFLGNSQSTKLLIGVNYYQTYMKNEECRIKGIGPVTIYQQLYDKVSAP